MKIGFCFLVKNEISREKLWKIFFDPVDHSEYSIYIHAKSPVVTTTLQNVFVERHPIETEWATISLVKATKKLLTTAFDDGCDAVVFLSGDSLPLWNFSTIQQICSETLFTLQPKDGLSKKQCQQLTREFQRIRDFYDLESSRVLAKQNMFFSIKKSDFELIRNIKVDSFPAKEVPDEYFWINQLIIKGRSFDNSNYIYANDDPTKTQSLEWVIDVNLLHQARSKGYLFIRKVVGFANTDIWKYYTTLIK